MAKLTRREFVGNRFLLVMLFIIPLLFPLGILYLLEGTVAIEEDIDNPEEFLRAFRSGNIGK